MSEDSQSEASEENAGPGHNQPAVVGDRWVKKRTFVRALEGTYGEMKRGLYDQKRVFSTNDMKWKVGSQAYGKHVINPKDTQVAQSIETLIHAFAPGGYAQNHGHMNTAAFYVMQGQGYDIHDGERIDYEAAEMLLIETGCVHQHHNASDEEEMIVVVLNAKPLFLFMHMVFQKTVKLPPKDPVPGMSAYIPPEKSW